MSSTIKPFEIAVAEEKIQLLKQRLALAQFPDEVIDAEPWSRGPPLSEIKRLAQYWGNGFDWRKVEADLNRLPQFTTSIAVEGFGTYNVHFIHGRSAVPHAIPLLFLHGWPGSFIEVTKILPPLLSGGEDFPAFHVVAPSLIDFGFSSASRKKSFNIDQHAEVCHKLMLALGYDEYVVQGGDIGSLVARMLAIKYGPQHCKAHHINSAAPAEPNAESHPQLYEQVQNTPLSESELAGLQRAQVFSTEGNGYYRMQATKPQTVGYSMADSPVGFLAWIYEKLHDWTDEYPWTDDEVLTWVSIYYFSTAGPAAPNCIYYENEHRDPPIFPAVQVYTDVPLGIARLPRDLILLPKLWHRTMGPIVYEKEYPHGGHFAAWECPDMLVNDLRIMFGRGGGAYGCVKQRSGY
ncbi:hypothetical protein BP6252_11410 [Coleophoma cylindrospora]|uniref:Epoxide hydrolase N-terminal domain-containing protein n=1 Tax=Coleophoma cylindrospora TaxID=1849047 RepID=A0A3D8QJQ4_9HELO|nr:hypothetical protein BP6252_11410 [Coleophoma cylindrospora]